MNLAEVSVFGYLAFLFGLMFVVLIKLLFFKKKRVKLTLIEGGRNEKNIREPKS